MDANWFFSSFAQAIASLVGVIAAFVIARLITNQGEFDRKSARTVELIDESNRLRDLANSRYFDWYNTRRREKALERVDDAVVQDEEVTTAADQYYDRAGFSPYAPRAEMLLLVHERMATAREVRREQERQERAATRSHGGIDWSRLMPPRENPITSVALNEQISQEGELIDRLWVDVRHHIRQVTVQYDAVRNNPESSGVIGIALWAILLLFWSGVIYPLSFLPTRPDHTVSLSISAFFEILFSLRGLLLAVATVIFSGLILYLWWRNRGLRYDPAQVEALTERQSYSTYSPYFAVRLANEMEATNARN